MMNLSPLYKKTGNEPYLVNGGCLLLDLDTRPSSVSASVNVTPPGTWITPPASQSATFYKSASLIRYFGGWRNNTIYLSGGGTGSNFSFAFSVTKIYLAVAATEIYWQFEIYTRQRLNPNPELRIRYLGKKTASLSNAKITGTYSNFDQTECYVEGTGNVPVPYANPYFNLNSIDVSL